MSHVGEVLSIALRGKDPREMREVHEAICAVDGVLEGDPASSVDRGITLISSRQWRQVICELGVELPWWTRRANVLVDTDGLGGYIGQLLKIGDVEIQIAGETKPCGLMDRLHPGLRSALLPDCRGGVHGRIVKGGVLRVGEAVELVRGQG